jgi:hypothetical protein
MSQDLFIQIFLYNASYKIYYLIEDRKLAIELLKDLLNDERKLYPGGLLSQRQYFLYREADYELNSRTIRNSFKEENDEIFYYLSKDLELLWRILNMVAKYGNMKQFYFIIKKFSNKKIARIDTILVNAASNKNQTRAINIINYLMNNYKAENLHYVAFAAAERGYLNIIQTMVNRQNLSKFELITVAIFAAGKEDIIDFIIKYCIKNKIELTNYDFDKIAIAAAKKGIMRKLRSNDHETIIEIAKSAASGGWRDIVHNMIKQQPCTNQDFIDIAKSAGCHVEIIVDMIDRASFNANDFHEILESAIVNKCEIKVKAVIDLVIKFLPNFDFSKIIKYAAGYGYLNIINFLIDKETDFDEIIIEAIRFGHAHIVKKFINYGSRNNLEKEIGCARFYECSDIVNILIKKR